MPVSRFDTLELSNDRIEDVLAVIRQETIDALTQSLEKVDRVSTGELSQSIMVDLPVSEGELSFILSMEDYWKFVDEGVNGTRGRQGSPFTFKKKNINQMAMLEFIANRGISAGRIATHYKNSKGDMVRRKNPLPGDKARKTLAFLIGRSMALNGVKPTHFYTNVINDEWKADFIKRIADAFGDDINTSFSDES